MDKPINIKTPVIKTLDEILADMGEPVSAKTFDKNSDNADNNNAKKPDITNNKDSNTKKSLKKPTTPIKNTQKPISQTSPANPPHKRQSQKSNSKPSAVDLLLNDNTQTVLDDDLLKLLSKVEIEKLAIPDRQTRYLRWLAFYYLGKREHSQKELRGKLLAKDCDPVAVDELLVEFVEKGYQSDERMTSALIKDGLGKNHGAMRILQTLKKHGLSTVSSVKGVQMWIDEHGEFFGELENNREDETVDWLAQAVSARCKKYGNTIPTDPKEKVRQLRFLQYRGFDMDICFRALKMTLDDFE